MNETSLKSKIQKLIIESNNYDLINNYIKLISNLLINDDNKNQFSATLSQILIQIFPHIDKWFNKDLILTNNTLQSSVDLTLNCLKLASTSLNKANKYSNQK